MEAVFVVISDRALHRSAGLLTALKQDAADADRRIEKKISKSTGIAGASPLELVQLCVAGCDALHGSSPRVWRQMLPAARCRPGCSANQIFVVGFGLCVHGVT